MIESFDKNLHNNLSSENNVGYSENEQIALKEFLFHEVITAKIVDTYERDLSLFNFSAEQISLMREKILSLSTDERESLYAFPWELKQRALPTFLQKIKLGSETLETMVDKIIDASRKQHRKVAYHASNEDIASKQEKSHGQTVDTWVIYGKEKDHRDEDLPMAYYSFDYENLYRTKNPKYIYIVSIQENDQLGHRKDGDNEWGRAPSLSVIEKINLEDVDMTVTKLLNEEIKKGHKQELAA